MCAVDTEKPAEKYTPDFPSAICGRPVPITLSPPYIPKVFDAKGVYFGFIGW